jgi:hypothetical protein
VRGSGAAVVTSVVHCEAGAGAGVDAIAGDGIGAEAVAGADAIAGAEAVAGGKAGTVGPLNDGSAEIGGAAGGVEAVAVAAVPLGRRSCFGPVVAGMTMRAGGA